MFNLLADVQTTTPLTTVILVFGIVVIAMSVFLIIAVLMQQGKQHNISGTIAGAADTFFGKTKGSTISKKLSVLTSVVAILFVILVLVYYIISTPDPNKVKAEAEAAADTQTEAVVDGDNTDETLSDVETEAGETEAGETEAGETETTEG